MDSKEKTMLSYSTSNDENPIIENENGNLSKKTSLPFIVPPQDKMVNFPERYKFNLLCQRYGYTQSMLEHSLLFS